MKRKHVTRWGTFEMLEDGDVVAVAVVPMLEKDWHNMFSIACGCGVRLDDTHPKPIFIHQEAHN